MTRSMGSTDRVLRTIAVLVIVGLLATGKIGGALAVLLGIVVAEFLLTRATG